MRILLPIERQALKIEESIEEPQKGITNFTNPSIDAYLFDFENEEAVKYFIRKLRIAVKEQK